MIFGILDGDPSGTETHAEPDPEGSVPMTQLLLIMAALAALPAIGKLVKAVVEFFVTLVMMIFVLGRKTSSSPGRSRGWPSCTGTRRQ